MSLEHFHPLPLLYKQAGRVLAKFTTIEPGELPQPYRDLLDHRGDMTSKLEEFHSAALELDVLFREEAGDLYRREVLLRTIPGHEAVEYGAIEINLRAFDEPLRSEILAGHRPLGGLLNEHGVRYHSEPRAFLRIAPDQRLAELFALSAPVELFGRSNVLLSASGDILAQIVEILPPA